MDCLPNHVAQERMHQDIVTLLEQHIPPAPQHMAATSANLHSHHSHHQQHSVLSHQLHLSSPTTHAINILTVSGNQSMLTAGAMVRNSAHMAMRGATHQRHQAAFGFTDATSDAMNAGAASSTSQQFIYLTLPHSQGGQGSRQQLGQHSATVVSDGMNYLTPSPDSPGQWSSSSPQSHSDCSKSGIHPPPSYNNVVAQTSLQQQQNSFHLNQQKQQQQQHLQQQQQQQQLTQQMLQQ